MPSLDLPLDWLDMIALANISHLMLNWSTFQPNSFDAEIVKSLKDGKHIREWERDYPINGTRCYLNRISYVQPSLTYKILFSFFSLHPPSLSLARSFPFREIEALAFPSYREPESGKRANKCRKFICNFFVVGIYVANNTTHLLCSSFGFNVVPCYRQPNTLLLLLLVVVVVFLLPKEVPFLCCVHTFHIANSFFTFLAFTLLWACLFGAFVVVSFRRQFLFGFRFFFSFFFRSFLFFFQLYLLFISIGLDGFVVPNEQRKATENHQQQQ